MKSGMAIEVGSYELRDDSVCVLSQMNALLFENCNYSSERFLYVSEIYMCTGSVKPWTSISFIGFIGMVELKNIQRQDTRVIDVDNLQVNFWGFLGLINKN